MLEDALELARDAMAKALERLTKELSRVRAGRANPVMLDEVRVESYGAQMSLKQVATVSVADARLLVVKPFDPNTIPAIEKAINAAQLGLNPQNDGVVIRVPVPTLTEERRLGLMKQAHELVEDAKIAIRQGRREGNDLLKDAEKDKDISEDDLKKGLEKIQSLTDEHTKRAEEAVKKKETEIMNE